MVYLIYNELLFDADNNSEAYKVATNLDKNMDTNYALIRFAYYIDTVDDVGIYYNYLDKYYFFTIEIDNPGNEGVI